LLEQEHAAQPNSKLPNTQSVKSNHDTSSLVVGFCLYTVYMVWHHVKSPTLASVRFILVTL